MKKGLFILMGLILLISGVALCLYIWVSHAPSGESPLEALIGQEKLSPEEEALKGMEFAETVQVYPKLSGLRVADISAMVGRKVEEGDVLVRLDSTVLLAELRSLQDKARRAEEEYRKVALLPSADVELRRAAYDEVRNELAKLQSMMGHSYVIAPVDGIVVSQSVKSGDISRVDWPMLAIGVPISEDQSGTHIVQ